MSFSQVRCDTYEWRETEITGSLRLPPFGHPDYTPSPALDGVRHGPQPWRTRGQLRRPALHNAQMTKPYSAISTTDHRG